MTRRLPPISGITHDGECDWCGERASYKMPTTVLSRVYMRACPQHRPLLEQLRETARNPRLK